MMTEAEAGPTAMYACLPASGRVRSRVQARAVESTLTLCEAGWQRRPILMIIVIIYAC